MERGPQLWIVAGPNGAGKSTVGSLTHEVDRVLDPDAVCRRIRGGLSLLALVLPATWYANLTNYVAVMWVEFVVGYALWFRQSVAVETVLSTRKYLKHARYARWRGFEVNMVFVALPDPEDHVLRVGLRERAGGHGVPPEKIRSRWYRSHANLALFAPLLDFLVVFSNAEFTATGVPEPTLVAEKRSLDGDVVIYEPLKLPEVTRQLQT